MDRDRAERIVQAYENLMRMVGAQSLEAAMEKICHWGEQAQKYLPFMLEMHASRAKLVALTATLPDEHAATVEAFMAAMPELIRVLFSRLHKGAAKAFPAPPGGRRSVPANRRAEVCQFVLATFGRGFPLGTAQKRAAAKFGLGLRTVQRIWRDRSRQPLALDAREFIRVLREEPLP